MIHLTISSPIARCFVKGTGVCFVQTALFLAANRPSVDVNGSPVRGHRHAARTPASGICRAECSGRTAARRQRPVRSLILDKPHAETVLADRIGRICL